jgi:hypothetical protein
MAKALDEMSNEELAEALEDLDQVISADQNLVADALRRLKRHARMRNGILDLLAQTAIRKGWNN